MTRREPRRATLPHIPRRVLFAFLIACALAPAETAGAPEAFPEQPFEQEFVITAYYSPLPKQCCYVRGNLAADKALNGEGVRGADGTEVFAGMLAAPPRYPFGTRVALPGIGVATVHDRGGAIQEIGGGVHRLDLWVGHGEEGLARALAFGVQRVRGTVYPLVSHQPHERIALHRLPAPLAMLKPFLAEEPDLLSLEVKEGDRSVSVQILQEHLSDAGYFMGPVSGWFGPETKAAIQKFLRDFRVDDPADRLTERTAAYLIAASRRVTDRDPFTVFVEKGSDPGAIIRAKRLLRWFGYYRGRTNGTYDDALFAAILKFQQDHALVGTADDPGAGRIGPLTKHEVLLARRRRLVARRAELLLMQKKIETMLVERGDVLEDFLVEGDKGNSVRLLQALLARRGFFPSERVSGLFGPVTRDAVLAYQKARGIVQSDAEKGAGFVGPATLAELRREQKRAVLRLVRAEGWGAL